MGVKEPNLYGSAEDRLDTMVGSVSKERMMIWACIRRARAEYEKNIQNNSLPTKEFIKWLSETWGIKITMAQDGYNLSHEIDIIADDKYTMFMLKYS